MDRSFVNEKVCILTEDEILSFQRLAKKVMGLDLTLVEAEDQGLRLIQSIELILDHKKKAVAKQLQRDENEKEHG